MLQVRFEWSEDIDVERALRAKRGGGKRKIKRSFRLRKKRAAENKKLKKEHLREYV